MKRLVFGAAVTLALLSGCARTVISRDPEGRKPTGFRYFDPKPYLLVKTVLGSDEVLDAQVIVLPDLSKPHYVTSHSGVGSIGYSVATTNGLLTKYDLTYDSKGPEVIEKVTTSFKGIVDALLAAQKAREAEAAAAAAKKAATTPAALPASTIAALARNALAGPDFAAHRAAKGKVDDPNHATAADYEGILQRVMAGEATHADARVRKALYAAIIELRIKVSALAASDDKALRDWGAAAHKVIEAILGEFSNPCAPTTGTAGTVPFEYRLYALEPDANGRIQRVWQDPGQAGEIYDLLLDTQSGAAEAAPRLLQTPSAPRTR